MQLALNPPPLAAHQSLFAANGRTLVTSRELSKRFRKHHKSVLRIIQAEIDDHGLNDRFVLDSPSLN